jgi:hypothetical protein
VSELPSKLATLTPTQQFEALARLPALPLLLAFTVSVFVLGPVSVGLWAHSVLRQAINPEPGFEKVTLLVVLGEQDVEDKDAQQLMVEKVGETIGGGDGPSIKTPIRGDEPIGLPPRRRALVPP